MRQNMEQSMKQTMTISEVAVYIGVSERTVYKLMRKKGLKHFYLGRKLMFLKESVCIWLKEQELNMKK